jgi:hypothetical protein
LPGRSEPRAVITLAVLALAALAAWRLGGAQQPPSSPDPAFINQLVAHQQQAMRALTNYCYQQSYLYEKLDDDDKVQRRDARLEVMCHDEGVPRSRALAIDGKPTGAKADDPWPPMARDENWKRRQREAAERSSRFQEIISEIPRAMIFTRVGEQVEDGRATTLYRLTPNPKYQPRSRTTELLKHVSGQAWLDLGAAQMVRVTAVVDSDFNLWGGLALRVFKGGSYELRQRPVNGVWLPWYAEERWHARIVLFKHIAQHQRIERSDFKPAAEVLSRK